MNYPCIKCSCEMVQTSDNWLCISHDFIRQSVCERERGGEGEREREREGKVDVYINLHNLFNFLSYCRESLGDVFSSPSDSDKSEKQTAVGKKNQHPSDQLSHDSTTHNNIHS